MICDGSNKRLIPEPAEALRLLETGVQRILTEGLDVETLACIPASGVDEHVVSTKIAALRTAGYHATFESVAATYRNTLCVRRA